MIQTNKKVSKKTSTEINLGIQQLQNSEYTDIQSRYNKILIQLTVYEMKKKKKTNHYVKRW